MAGLTSALVSYVGNAIFVRYLAEDAVRWIVPIIEEFSKTISATVLGASILLTHITFALIESIYDITKRSSSGVSAAIISLCGHTLFGLITLIVTKVTGYIWYGIAASIAIHTIWNNYVMSKRQKLD